MDQAIFLPVLGRKREVNDIHNLLNTDGINIVFLSGEAGIGKTALATRYMAEYRDEYYYQIWCPVRAKLSDTIKDLRNRISVRWKDTDADLLQEQTAVYLTNVRHRFGKPPLIILDGANDKDVLAEHHHFFQKCGAKILITTKATPFTLYHYFQPVYKVSELKISEALQVFQHYYRYSMTPHEVGQFDKIYELVGGIPLILELLAKNLYGISNPIKKQYPFDMLVGDLRKGGVANLTQQVEVETFYHNYKEWKLRKEFPKNIILSMYSFSGVDEDKEALLVSLCSLCSAEWISYEDIKKLARPNNTRKFSDNIGKLCEKGFILSDCDKRTGNEKYRISNVVRDIVRINM